KNNHRSGWHNRENEWATLQARQRSGPARRRTDDPYFFIPSSFFMPSFDIIPSSFFMPSLDIVSFFMESLDIVSFFMPSSLPILSWANAAGARASPSDRTAADTPSAIRVLMVIGRSSL